MKNMYGLFTPNDDEREYEESLEKDLENNDRHHHHQTQYINKTTINSGDLFLSKDIIQSKKFQG